MVEIIEGVFVETIWLKKHNSDCCYSYDVWSQTEGYVETLAERESHDPWDNYYWEDSF